MLGPLDVVKCVCLRGLIGDDLVCCRVLKGIADLPMVLRNVVGEERYFLLELEPGMSKASRYVRFGYPLPLRLPLRGPIWSEKIAASLSGELMSWRETGN